MSYTFLHDDIIYQIVKRIFGTTSFYSFSKVNKGHSTICHQIQKFNLQYVIKIQQMFRVNRITSFVDKSDKSKNALIRTFVVHYADKYIEKWISRNASRYMNNITPDIVKGTENKRRLMRNIMENMTKKQILEGGV